MNRLKTPFVSFLLTFVLFTLLMRTGGVAAASGWGPDAWNIVSSPNVGAASQLNGVTALSKSNIWAVGDCSDVNNPLQTLIEHWDGARWRVVSRPHVGTFSQLNAIAAISAHNIWAVGNYSNGSGFSQTLIEHWNGTSWSVVPSPNVGTSGNGF